MPAGQVQQNPAIRTPGPVTPADVDNVRDLFGQGLGVAETARRLGLSTNQVTGIKRKHGLTSKPAPNAQQLHEASEAFASKARRERHSRREKWQRIVDRLLDELEADLTSGQVKTILRGVQGIESEEIVSKIPARDLREKMSAITAGEQQIQKIDALEDDQGLARGLSMLETFTQAAAALAGGKLPAPREGLIQE